MATLFNNAPDKDKEKDPNAQAGGAAAPTLGGGGEAATIGGGMASTAPQGTASGRFTNVQNYIKANQGFNAGGGGLAGKVSGRIAGAGEEVKHNVGEAQNAFNQQAENNKSKWNYDEGLVHNALGDSSNFVKDAGNVDKFAAMRDAQYSGPNSLRDLSGDKNLAALQTKAQNVQNMAAQTGTEQGRFNLLKQMFNKQGYSGGQQRLDNLLLQGNKDQAQALQGTRQVANTINRQIGATDAATQQQAQALQQQAVDTQGNVRNQIGSTVGDVNTGIGKRVGDVTTVLDDKYKKVLDAVDKETTYNGMVNRQGTRGVSKNADFNNIEKQWGIGAGAPVSGGVSQGPGWGRDITDVDLRKFISKQNAPINQQTVATPEEYAKINALKQLSGGVAGDADFLNAFTDPTKAGTVNENTTAYTLADKKKVLDAITNRNNYYAGSQAYMVDGHIVQDDPGHDLNYYNRRYV